MNRPEADFLIAFKQAMQSAGLLNKLLRKDINDVHLKHFYFVRVPLEYSEPSLRSSYIVYSEDGRRYFCKINSYAPKIQQEVDALKLLQHQAPEAFQVPALLAWDRNASRGVDENSRCGWLLTEWVDGAAPRPDDDRQLELCAVVLARINEVMIEVETLERLSGHRIPDRDSFGQAVRAAMIADLEAAVNIVDGRLNRELREAIDLFNKGRVPFMWNLNHGDFHFNNILLRKTAHTYDVIVVDWEDCTLENPLHDLANFLLHTEPTIGQAFMRVYFDHMKGAIACPPWPEISEMVMLMVKVWLSRNLRWKSRQIADRSSFRAYCQNQYRRLVELERLPWRDILS